jgi:hypothetical protein
MICAAPCIAVTVLEVLVCFVLGPSPRMLPYAMILAYAALGLLPVALTSLILVLFVKRRQGLCLSLSAIYFVGWAVLLFFI